MPSAPRFLCSRPMVGSLAVGPVVTLDVAAAADAAPATTRPTPFPTAASMNGQVFVGYQGWFAPAVEGTNLRWVHYGHGNAFRPGHAAIEMWPDLTRFDPDELFPTDFRHADGRVAHVFSSAHPRTVDRHFRWMREHGIDGAFLQRFGVTVKNDQLRGHANQVLANVRRAAATHGLA